MKPMISRRQFLESTALTGSCLGLGNLGFLSQLQPVSAAEAAQIPARVQLEDDIEPVVRFLEDTPRERLLEETAGRIRQGLSYQDLLAALLLAGVRNIQPRPVGFKFHAVLVVHSAHQASLASPDAERWLPIFWALDHFKSSQARDVREGDWTMSRVDESKVPPAHLARQAFIDAMDRWDEEAADVAAAGLARTAGAQEVFDLYSRYGARDFRDIGHKAIYVANSFRTLQTIGWRHAEPVLRSLAYALLMHDKDDPLHADLPADRPGRRNLEALRELPDTWLEGKPSPEATRDILELIRSGAALDMSRKTIALLNQGVAAQSIWDGLFAGGSELLMRAPGILSLHSLTCTNALHYSWRHCTDDATRRFMLLQAASFLPLFRGRNQEAQHRVDTLSPTPPQSTGTEGVAEIFSELSKNRLEAAQKILAWLDAAPRPEPFLHAARRMIFVKGTDAHDYKMSSAVLEDFRHLSPAWRNRFLAASAFYWKGSNEADNALVQRTRHALVGS